MEHLDEIVCNVIMKAIEKFCGTSSVKGPLIVITFKEVQLTSRRGWLTPRQNMNWYFETYALYLLLQVMNTAFVYIWMQLFDSFGPNVIQIFIEIHI